VIGAGAVTVDAVGAAVTEGSTPGSVGAGETVDGLAVGDPTVSTGVDRHALVADANNASDSSTRTENARIANGSDR